MNKVNLVFSTTPEAVVLHTPSHKQGTPVGTGIRGTVPAFNVNQIQTLTNPVPLKTHINWTPAAQPIHGAPVLSPSCGENTGVQAAAAATAVLIDALKC